MTIMFLNDMNKFEARDPVTTIVEINQTVTTEQLRAGEETYNGAHHAGGKIEDALAGIEYKIIWKGKKSMYKGPEADLVHKLISGNY